jgi:hypothetical protein
MNVMKTVLNGPPLDKPKSPGPAAETPALVQRSPFAIADGGDKRPLLLEDIARAFGEKRAEQKAKLKEAADLLQRVCDILNSLDA